MKAAKISSSIKPPSNPMASAPCTRARWSSSPSSLRAKRPRLLTSPPPAAAPWKIILGEETTTAAGEALDLVIGEMTATDMAIGAAEEEAVAASVFTAGSMGIWLGIALTKAEAEAGAGAMSVVAVEAVTTVEGLGIWRESVLVEIAAVAAAEVGLVLLAVSQVILRGIACEVVEEAAAAVATAVVVVVVVLEGLAAEAAVEVTVSNVGSLDTSRGNAKARRE